MRIIAFDTGFLERRLPPFALPILKGPLKGRKWLPASGFKFFSGNFEPDKTAVIHELVHPGDVVYDAGAHVGYYSVIMSQLVGPTGLVVSFEPNPLNARHLKRHLRLNGCANVKVYQACVGGANTKCRFETRCSSVAGHVSDEGDVAADMVNLDSLLQSGEIPLPNFMKIDVEGAEMDALQGAESIITQARPVILLATHSDELDRACTEYLTDHGYVLKEITPFEGDREVLAVPAGD